MMMITVYMNYVLGEVSPRRPLCSNELVASMGTGVLNRMIIILNHFCRGYSAIEQRGGSCIYHPISKNEKLEFPPSQLYALQASAI